MRRPRLGDHVRARGHEVGGRELVVLHSDRGGAVCIGPREWVVLRGADGTRDLEGMQKAAANAGVRVGTRDIDQFVRGLDELGFFDDSSWAGEAPSFARDLPVVALPSYRFRCDGSGACCRSFSSVLFLPMDVVRARAALPDEDPTFFPAHGVSTEISAVRQKDGACHYLAADGRCRIQAAAGADAKPIGCRRYPIRYVDVGTELRVVPRLECACVFASAQRDDGAPLTSVSSGAELPKDVYVDRLHERVEVGDGWLAREEVVALCDSLEVPDEGDVPALVWELAAGFGEGPSLRDAFLHVARSAERLVALSSWRSPADLVLANARRVHEAALAAAVAPAPVRARADEVLYARASFFACLGAERSFEADLRRLALVMWIARGLEAPHAIAHVELLARGHGLDLEPPT